MHSVILVSGLISLIVAGSLNASGDPSGLLVGAGFLATTAALFHPRTNLRHAASVVALDCHRLQDWKSLTTELARRGFRVISLESLLASASTRAQSGTKPDALALGADLSDDHGLARIRDIRRTAELCEIPILAITDFRRVRVPTDRIRSHGIVSLLDLHSGTDRIVSNIERIANCAHEDRFAERTPCFIPVGVQSQGTPLREFAVNLSKTGMRLTSTLPLQRNQRISLSFDLPMVARKRVSVRGRVVYQTQQKNSHARYEVGVAFNDCNARSRRLLEREITRLLTL
jgi:PilZ domain